MKVFEIRQRFWALGDKFDIKDQYDQVCYQVEGSLMKWFKEFTIRNQAGQQVAFIKRQFSWPLPRFTVELEGGRRLTIQKELAWFKPRYHIEGLDLVVEGNVLELDFALTKDGQRIATINQYWLKLTSTYQVTVYEEAYCDLVLALVIAIDHVKARQRTQH